MSIVQDRYSEIKRQNAPHHLDSQRAEAMEYRWEHLTADVEVGHQMAALRQMAASRVLQMQCSSVPKKKKSSEFGRGLTHMNIANA